MKPKNNIEMDLKTKILLNIYLKPKNISIIDILKNAGFDTNIPSKLYIDKSYDGSNELVYEYKNQKYNIYLRANGYVGIIKYSYYNNGESRQHDIFNIYKINKNTFQKTTIQTIHSEINTNAHYKKNENGELVETTYEDDEFHFSHQEVYWGEKKIWAIRVMANESYPYEIELIYYPLNNGKMPDIKIDTINQKLKEYFATIDLNTPIIEVLKKICEISSITIDELSNGFLSFGFAKRDKNYKYIEGKYMYFKDGTLKAHENNEEIIYEKVGNDYIQIDENQQKLKL